MQETQNRRRVGSVLLEAEIHAPRISLSHALDDPSGAAANQVEVAQQIFARKPEKRAVATLRRAQRLAGQAIGALRLPGSVEQARTRHV